MRLFKVKQIVSKEFIYALIVLATGFGMMNIMWLIYLYSGGSIRPGLYDYYAATIGDCICLPAMTYSGLKYLSNTYFLKKKNTHLAIIAFAVATGIQISWLLDPDINPNWTIPRVHYFNFAGWYHAAFFVVIITVMSYIIGGIWDRRHKKETSALSMYFAFGDFLFLFFYMYALDDYVPKYGILIVFFVIFLLGVIFNILFRRIIIKNRKELITMFINQFIVLFIAIGIYII